MHACTPALNLSPSISGEALHLFWHWRRCCRRWRARCRGQMRELPSPGVQLRRVDRIARPAATLYTASNHAQVLQAVAVAVRGQMGELLAAVSAPSSGLHGFDFLGGSLMPEVDAAVGRSLPGAIRASCFDVAEGRAGLEVVPERCARSLWRQTRCRRSQNVHDKVK